MDNRGYTARIIKAVNSADSKSSLGVRLGKFCISRDIPVSDVAEFFGVSRMTIYKWFVGEWIPRKRHTENILKIIGKAK
jgi:hypothetical protein